jgi:peptidoglycan/xylan/chitin deacetylase (PgdA/CDA1 family)
MTYSVTRSLAIFILSFAVCGLATAATAADCPGNPDAIGTSRTIVVDPTEHTRVGAMSYAEMLPLADKEMVLTLDDGPIAPYTGKILDILASECVHATYFIVGDMARHRPDLVQRAYREGHTIGTHSMSHPYRFRALSFEKAKAQIDDGIEATTAALGEAKDLAPFFRFPGFGNTESSEEYLASRGIMVWSADIPADDWTHIGPREIVRRALTRLEQKGKGVLLLHDIHPATVAALPMLLKELKERGYHIVHVVPASKDNPKTETTPEAWLVPDRRRYAATQGLALSEVQSLNTDFLSRHSSEDLCSLKAMTGRSWLLSARHSPRHSSASRHSSMSRMARARAGHADRWDRWW